MLIYIFVMLFSFICLNISKKQEKAKRNLLIGLAFLSLFLVSALRYNVGSDFQTYQKWYFEIDSFYFHYMDFAIKNLIFLLKFFTNNSQLFFAITSFIILFFIFKAAFKIDENEYDMIIFLFVALGFYFSTFNGIRQWIAATIFLYAFHFIKEKSFFKYLIWILFASLFHISALFLIPIYFLFQINIIDKYKILILLITYLFFKFINVYDIIAWFLKIFFKTYYLRYVVQGHHDIMQNHGSYFPILLSLGMLIYYIIMKSRCRKVYSEKEYNSKKNICFIICFFAILNTVNYLFSRISSIYFLPLLIFVLPDFYKIFTGKTRKALKIFIIIVGVLYLTMNTMIKNSHDVLPYESVFNISYMVNLY